MSSRSRQVISYYHQGKFVEELELEYRLNQPLRFHHTLIRTMRSAIIPYFWSDVPNRDHLQALAMLWARFVVSCQRCMCKMRTVHATGVPNIFTAGLQESEQVPEGG